MGTDYSYELSIVHWVPQFIGHNKNFLGSVYKDRSTNLFSNVYVVFYLGLLAEIDNASQEVEQTLKRFELLKQINQWACCQLLVVFGGNLNHNLEKRIFD